MGSMGLAMVVGMMCPCAWWQVGLLFATVMKEVVVPYLGTKKYHSS